MDCPDISQRSTNTVTDFLVSKYGPVFESLIDTSRATAIGEGSSNRDLYTSLQKLSLDNAFIEPIVDENYAAACISGVWLWNDFLDESHAISQ